MDNCGQDDGPSNSFGKNNPENEEIDNVFFESTMRAMPQYMGRLFKTIDPLVFLLKTPVKTDTSRDEVLLRSSEEIKISAEYLSSKIDNIPVPQENPTEDNVKGLHSHVKRNKEVLEELGKCWITFEEMLGKNLNNFHNTLKQNCATLVEQVSEKISDVTSL